MDQCTSLHVQQLAIEGKNQSEIAKQVGVDPSTISRALSDEKVRAKIEYVRAMIVNEAYEKSARNVIKVIEDFQNSASDSDRVALQAKDHGFKASVKVLESMGVLPSQSPSLFVQQVFNTQVNNYVSPVVDRLLESAVIDVDVSQE